MQEQRSGRRVHSGSWVLFVAALLLVSSATVASAATKIVSDADKGLAVQLKAGDVLEVRLASNPSTGYQWTVDPQSTKLLKLTGQSQTDAAPGEGRPIVQIFRFETKGKGTGTLLLHSMRSWEKADPNEEQYSLQVTVE